MSYYLKKEHFFYAYEIPREECNRDPSAFHRSCGSARSCQCYSVFRVASTVELKIVCAVSSSVGKEERTS